MTGQLPTRGHVAAYPREAALEIISQLREAGHDVSNVNDAVKLGLITDMQWCDVLERHRSTYMDAMILQPGDNPDDTPKKIYQREYMRKRRGRPKKAR